MIRSWIGVVSADPQLLQDHFAHASLVQVGRELGVIFYSLSGYVASQLYGMSGTIEFTRQRELQFRKCSKKLNYIRYGGLKLIMSL
jgi:hypothetical protein